MRGANASYFSAIREAVSTSVTGVIITWQHLKDAVFCKRWKAVSASEPGYFQQEKGIVTLNYPHEKLPVPDHGRYQLHNEIDDCIVCDKCAKICPVDCIEIEAIKSPTSLGNTSDGTPKRLYAAKFDIDMAKCCFCGLCTTVCPTECLTMTNEYDFSVFDIGQMNFQFGTMTPEEVDLRKKEAEEALLKKQAAKAPPQTSTEKATTEDQPAKPIFRPTFKPKVKSSAENTESPAGAQPEKPESPSATTEDQPAKPVFRPTFKPKAKTSAENTESPAGAQPEKPESPSATTEDQPAKPVFRPKFKPKASGGQQQPPDPS
jgi:NADH-quinone oxidoreductase subunit I